MLMKIKMDIMIQRIYERIKFISLQQKYINVVGSMSMIKVAWQLLIYLKTQKYNNLYAICLEKKSKLQALSNY